MTILLQVCNVCGPYRLCQCHALLSSVKLTQWRQHKWQEMNYYSSIYSQSCVHHQSVVCTLKADSHTACRAHAVPLPCRAAKGLECVFPIWFTQCGRVWFTLAMPRTCCALTMPFYSWPQHSRRRETACGRPARYRLIPATTQISRKFVIRSILISAAGGHCETKQRLHRRGKAYCFGARTWVFV